MLEIALKEWAVVCDLLIEGELAILLRKGGIHEWDGPGRFKLEHDRFALFPAWEHQNPDWIKPAYRKHASLFDAEPASFDLQAMATVQHIWPIPSRDAFDKLDDLHCWEKPQIDMRFNYKPERPIYLMAVRAYTLDQPFRIEMTPEYGGCRSWVDLKPEDQADDTGATPALEQVTFDAMVDRITQTMAP